MSSPIRRTSDNFGTEKPAMPDPVRRRRGVGKQHRHRQAVFLGHRQAVLLGRPRRVAATRSRASASFSSSRRASTRASASFTSQEAGAPLRQVLGECKQMTERVQPARYSLLLCRLSSHSVLGHFYGRHHRRLKFAFTLFFGICPSLHSYMHLHTSVQSYVQMHGLTNVQFVTYVH